jgi:hypothetical protein
MQLLSFDRNEKRVSRLEKMEPWDALRLLSAHLHTIGNYLTIIYNNMTTFLGSFATAPVQRTLPKKNKSQRKCRQMEEVKSE